MTSVIMLSLYLSLGLAPSMCPSTSPRVAALGDSITQNILNNYGPKSYPQLLEEHLGASARVANFGWGGDTATGAAARYTASIRGRGFNVLVVEICTNDFAAGDSGPTCWAKVEALADAALQESGMRLILATVMPRKGSGGYGAPIQTAIDSFNTSVRAYVAARALDKPGRVRLADLYISMGNPSDPAELLPAYNYGDGVHPSNAGLQQIESTVYSAGQAAAWW